MHFTYREPTSGEDLQQGDVLKRTQALDDILKAYHPYYLNPEYTHFLILTQSCDLVKRDGSNPKAPYISIAAVRPLAFILKREADKYHSSELLRVASVIERGKKPHLREFVKKVLNNNHTEFFYLHDDAQIGLQRSCALLRLAVSVRCLEHYETLLNSRTVSLDKEFQAKLGWLVGNLYSRVGTEDWAPNHYPNERWERIVDDILDEHYTFIDDSKARAAKKKPEAKTITDRDAARDFIDKVRVPTKREEAIGAIVEVLISENLLDKSLSEKARKHLQNTAALSGFFK